MKTEAMKADAATASQKRAMAAAGHGDGGSKKLKTVSFFGNR